MNNEFKTFLGKTVILGANIDLGGRDWIPIAENYFFSGTFDGAGHSISGLAIGSSDSRNSTLSQIGLFAYIGSDAIIRNVSVDTAGMYSNNPEAEVGGLVGQNDGNILNCFVKGNIKGGSSTGKIHPKVRQYNY